jgi:hypothetical protein
MVCKPRAAMVGQGGGAPPATDLAVAGELVRPPDWHRPVGIPPDPRALPRPILHGPRVDHASLVARERAQPVRPARAVGRPAPGAAGAAAPVGGPHAADLCGGGGGLYTARLILKKTCTRQCAAGEF